MTAHWVVFIWYSISPVNGLILAGTGRESRGCGGTAMNLKGSVSHAGALGPSCLLKVLPMHALRLDLSLADEL